jgi:hypothetical protein
MHACVYVCARCTHATMHGFVRACVRAMCLNTEELNRGENQLHATFFSRFQLWQWFTICFVQFS